MENNHTFTLINGEFLPRESHEILYSVFKSKINFHKMRNFSFQERFGTEDQTALKRIAELEHTLELISKVINSAEKTGYQMKIKSDIMIELSKANDLVELNVNESTS